MDKQASATYRTQQVMSASPTECVAMLYDEAVRALRKAVEAIAAGDIEGRWKSNKKAQDILYHLDGTLNFEQGGEIALNLSQLYRYVLRRLIQVDVDNDPAPAEEAIALLRPLQASWRQLASGKASARGAAADGARPVPRSPAKPAPDRTAVAISA